MIKCLSIRSNDVCLQPPDTKARIADAFSTTETILMQILYLLTEALTALVPCQTVEVLGVVFQYNSLILNSEGRTKQDNDQHHQKCWSLYFHSWNDLDLYKWNRPGKYFLKCDKSQNTNKQYEMWIFFSNLIFSPIQKDWILKFMLKYQGHKRGWLCSTKAVNYLTAHYRPVLKIRVLEQEFYLFTISTETHQNEKANQ